MFKAIGGILAIYVIYSVVTGRIYVKAGIRGRMVQRDESPTYFWVCVVIYAGLAVSVFTFF